jgi:hypothetical protein
MRVDWRRFRKKVCPKCEKFTGEKPVFGKCMGHFDDIYTCARKMIFPGSDGGFKPKEKEE